MPAIILKQRCFHPNHPKTAVSNAEHIRYIAIRIGVVQNMGMPHGLFGKAFGMDYGNIENLTAFQKTIKEISDKKTIMYRCIISLDEKDALRKGFDKRYSWEQAVKVQLNTIAKTMNIPIEKLEYCGAVHMDKGHPHIHFIYWEREQGIKRPWIEPQQSNNIRKAFTKSIFAEELSACYSAKDIAEKNIDTLMKVALANLYGDGVDEEELKLLEIMRASDPSLNPTKLRYNRVALIGTDEILMALDTLWESLPKTGRFDYAFMPSDVKEQIGRIIEKILDSNMEVRREFYSYVNAAMAQTELFSSNENYIQSHGKKAYQFLEKKLGNLILKKLKTIAKEERSNEHCRHVRRQQFESLLTDVFSLLSSLSSQQEAHGSYHLNGELSKQAKKELAMELDGSDNTYHDMGR